jgi:hypothetical protein
MLGDSIPNNPSRKLLTSLFLILPLFALAFGPQSAGKEIVIPIPALLMTKPALSACPGYWLGCFSTGR